MTIFAIAVVAPSAVAASSTDGKAAQSEETASTGGAEFGTATPNAFPTVPGNVAVIDDDGLAAAPANAPQEVKEIIWAGNEIIGMPYRYGGGHGDFEDTGYDCSGTISYALAGADLLRRPRDSRSFFRFGAAGKGAWVTIYTNSGHAYMTVAGIRLDTSAADDRGGAKGPRWRPLRRSNAGLQGPPPRRALRPRVGGSASDRLGYPFHPSPEETAWPV